MKVDHSLFFVSTKLSAGSFGMPSRPMKRSRSGSRDGRVDRPLKRASLAPVNSTDIFPPRPVFHTMLPLMDFSPKPSITPLDSYSMTPRWGPRPQTDPVPQSLPSYGNQIDDGDVRMDCDSIPRRSASPSASPLSSNSPAQSPSPAPNTDGIPSQTPKPLMNCPSMEMSETIPPVSQGTQSPIIRSGPSKRPRFTMGPRSDCEKCRAGVRGHWGHLT